MRVCPYEITTLGSSGSVYVPRTAGLAARVLLFGGVAAGEVANPLVVWLSTFPRPTFVLLMRILAT